jgi:hypothetical protein
MLTDEELTTRLGAALRDSVPEMAYAGPMPRVRRRAGLAATSVLAAGAALALVPAALEWSDGTSSPTAPGIGPGTGHSLQQGHTVIRTLDLGGVRLAYADVDGMPGELYFVVGPDLSVPPDAEKVAVDFPGDVWFVHAATGDEPQVYVRPGDSSMLFGLLAPGWTRQQLIDLLEHPVKVQRGKR